MPGVLDSFIDQCKMANKDPLIAVSVDMMDTGIDVPECVKNYTDIVDVERGGINEIGIVQKRFMSILPESYEIYFCRRKNRCYSL